MLKLTKHYFIMGALLIVVIILGFGLLRKTTTAVDPNLDMSQDPESWIVLNAEDEGVYVDVPMATKGNSEYVFSQLRYLDEDGSIRSVIFQGYYSGEPFSRIFYEEDVPKMRIIPGISPNDGILDFFAVYKEEDGNKVMYLVVDQDWKDVAADQINVIWGANISDPSTVNQELFDFSHEVGSVYYMKIEDISWIEEQNPVIGKIIVGQISLSDVFAGKTDSTFVILT